MSADRQRLVSSIRRIAKTDPEIRGLLDAADNKGGKPGAAGVGGGQGEGKEDQICCDGSVSDPNPGVDERDATDGDQDGLDPNDPANLGGLDGGSLTGVTDCATGQPICFDGDGFIPPDGWDGPDDPPLPSDWVEGRIVRATETNTGEKFFFWTCSGAKEYVESLTGVSPQHCGGAVANGSGYTFRVDTFSCIAYPEKTQCTEPPPPVDEWPTDGCVNLAVKSGTIVGSKYDPENDGSYSAPRDEIPLCDGANKMYLAPSGSEPGGWKTINSTKTEGYLYNSKFEQIAHIDGNEYSDPAM